MPIDNKPTTPSTNTTSSPPIIDSLLHLTGKFREFDVKRTEDDTLQVQRGEAPYPDIPLRSRMLYPLLKFKNRMSDTAHSGMKFGKTVAAIGPGIAGAVTGGLVGASTKLVNAVRGRPAKSLLEYMVAGGSLGAKASKPLGYIVGAAVGTAFSAVGLPFLLIGMAKDIHKAAKLTPEDLEV